MWNSIKKFFLPHEDNKCHPPIWKRQGSLLFLGAIFLIEGYFLTSSYLILNKEGFLASIFPNALIALTNDVRSDSHLAKLTPSGTLTKAAQLKADDMAARGYFSHYTPEGNSPWTFFKKADYPFTYAGENLAINFVDSKDVVDAWVKSPTHYANIIKGTYTQIGIATAEGKYQGKNTIYIVEFFGTPKQGFADNIALAPITATSTNIAASATTTALTSTTTPLATIKTASTTTVPAEVLGLEIDPEGVEKTTPMTSPNISHAPLFLSYPKHVIYFILITLIGLICILLCASLKKHNQMHHEKIIKTALYFILILLFAIFFNHIFGIGVVL